MSWGGTDTMSRPPNDKTSPNSKGVGGHTPHLLIARPQSGWRCCADGEGSEPMKGNQLGAQQGN